MSQPLHDIRMKWGVAAILLLAVAFGPVLSLALTPPVSTPIVNRATVTYADANGNLLPEVSATAQTPLSGAPVLNIAKQEDSDPVAMGALLNYTITYENTGNAPASNAIVEDRLSDYVEFQNASDGGVYTAGEHVVRWSLDSVEPGESGELTLAVLVKTPVDYGPGDPGVIQAGSLIYNTAVMAADEGASDETIVTTVGESPNLQVVKSVSSDVVSPGGVLTYTIDYENIGNDIATGVFIRDDLPAGTAYVENSLTGPGSIDYRTLTWNIGNLPPGGNGSVSYGVRVSPLAAPGSRVRNTCTIASREQGVMPSNETVTYVSVKAELSVTKLDRPDPVYVGNLITYTLVLKNEGDIPLTNITVTDVIPDKTRFVSAGDGGILTDNTVTWTLDDLDPGEETSVDLVVQVGFDLSEGDTITNTASAVANEIPMPAGSAVTTVSERTPGVVDFFDPEWIPAISYGVGDTICMAVTDLDRNTNPEAEDEITVVLNNAQTGDSEIILLTETGADTGVFRNCIQSTGDPGAENDGEITVAEDTGITVTYTDPLDASPVSEDAALIDPFGVVFDAATGDPVASAVVTLMDAATDQPADLSAGATGLPYDQDNPVTTGASGSFAFRLVPPGTYYFLVEPGGEYIYPSVVSDPDLPPGFIVDTGSRGEYFTLSAGDPPLNLDIPVDPPPGELSVVKTANKTSAAIGDIVVYTVTLTNNGNIPVAGLNITDTMPHGVQYLDGSTRLNGARFKDPENPAKRVLLWTLDSIAGGESAELSYRAVVGPDSQKGNGENRVVVQGKSAGQTVTSNTAKHKLDITRGVFTEKAVIIGKVFLDLNGDRIQENPDPAMNPVTDHAGDRREGKEYGIGKVVLFLEDGTRVITDGQGKFSIHGVVPGTHVLRLDETTLPDGLVPVPVSNRFMGDDASQFADIMPGQLFKANFAVIGTCSQTPGMASCPMAHPGKNVSPTDAPAPSNAAPADEKNNEQAAPPSLEKQSMAMTPGLDILSPEDGDVIQKSAVNVAIKTPVDVNLQVWVNNLEIGDDRIGKKIVNKKSRVAIYEYVALSLKSAESNTVRARITDSFGNVRGEKEIRITAVGPPARIVVKPDRTRIPADGKYVTPVTAMVLDANGSPVSQAAYITVSLDMGDITEEDADPATEGCQIPCKNGLARFNIRSPHDTGDADIRVFCNDIEGAAPVFFEPNLRSMIMVGVGEIMVGHGKTRGADGFLEKNGGIEKGTYAKTRGAAFVKGKVYKDILLTAAYDSDKEKQEEFFKTRDTDLDSESKYPVYGDESKLGYEAYSREKLYLRLDKNKSHVMYGDFHTELNDAKLGAYTRTFTGIKTDIHTDRVKFRSFISDTDQTQVLDEIRGRGISGYYHLRFNPVVFGSETVTIETRDRYRPDRVITREASVRWTDYAIDYDAGTLLFKSPIPSYDSDFNPVYIIVSYESETADEKHYTYGGRGELALTDRVSVGVTGLMEEKEGDDYNLIGTDVALKLPGNTLVKGEWAKTQSAFDENGTMGKKTDDAWLFELSSKPTDTVELEAYFRYAGNHFDNLSASDISRGTKHYGIDASWRPTPDVLIRGRHFDEKDLLNDGAYRHTSVGMVKSFEKTQFSFDVVKETADDAYVPETEDTTREPFDISKETPEDLLSVRLGMETSLTPDLTLEAGHEQDVSDNDYNLSRVGLKYRINDTSRVYVKEEYGKYDDRRETRTLIGAEKQIGRNTTAYNEYRLEDGADGARNHQVIGLNNKFRLGKKVTGNIAVEHLKTLSGDARNTQPDAFGIATALAYLPKDKVKLTTRLEYRQENSDTNQQSWLGEIGAAVKISDDYTLLIKERYFRDDYDGAGRNVTSRAMLGLAYRPVHFDRFNALAKFAYEYEKDEIQAAPYAQDSFITSLEGIYQYSRKFQIGGKYAAKLVKDNGYDSFTDMISGRILYDITDRFDIGAEYRLLNSRDMDAYTHGGSLEVGCRVIENLWLSLGYAFDEYETDPDFEDYRGHGPYIRIRFKFDENLIAAD